MIGNPSAVSRLFCSTLLALIACLGAFTPTAEAADLAAKASFNIVPQKLATALVEFSRQANTPVVSATGDIERFESPGVNGTMSLESALKALLAGTDLASKLTNSGAIAIGAFGQPQAGDRSAGPSIHLAQADTPDHQSSTETESSGRENVQEIIVTATKREERLLNVPMSMSVLTANDIRKRGLVDGEDYLRGMPGVAQGDSGLSGHFIVIRGLATDLIGQTITSGTTVSTYFGEVPTTYSFGIGGSDVDLKLVDIERIEVLKGPQGTSFGASSLGGAVRTIPVAPKLNRFEGQVGAGYSQTGGNGGPGHMLQGVLNLPLIADKLAIRGVLYDYLDSGYYRNNPNSNPAFLATALALGAGPYVNGNKRVGDSSVTGGRLSLLYQATDKLKFTLNYLRQLRKLDGDSKQNIESGSYDQLELGVAPEHIVTGITGGADSYINIINPVLEYDLGWSDLLATYSYTKGGSLMSVSDTAGGTAPWPSSWWGPSTFRESVSEVRLATKFDAPVNFLAGLFYANNPHDDRILEWRWIGTPGADPFGFGVRQMFYSQDYRKLTQKAAFAEASWQFASRFKLTVGARTYDYDRTVHVINDGPLLGGHQEDTHHVTASGTNWKGNLSFKPSDDSMIYASWAEGFRLGKPQAPLPAPVCDVNNDGLIDGSNIPLSTTGSVNSDTVDSSEVGIKFAALDRRLSVDAAVFRVNWNEMPIGIVVGGCPLVFTANAGAARSEGVELQMSYDLTEELSADLGASWINAKLTKDAPGIGGVAGDRLPGSPKVNGNLGLQYGFKLANRDASIRADATYIGLIDYGVQAWPTNGSAGDYVKLDVRGHMAFGNKIGLDVYVRNLTNDDAYTLRAGPVGGWRLQPRTFGLQVQYDF